MDSLDSLVARPIVKKLIVKTLLYSVVLHNCSFTRKFLALVAT